MRTTKAKWLRAPDLEHNMPSHWHLKLSFIKIFGLFRVVGRLYYKPGIRLKSKHRSSWRWVKNLPVKYT